MTKECDDCLRQCFEVVKALISRDKGNASLKNIKYLSRLHLQYCASLSQQSRHKEALEQAKYGVKYALMALNKTIKIAECLASFDGTLIKRSAAHSSFVPDTSVSAASSTRSIIGAVASKLLPILYELRLKATSESDDSRLWNWRRSKTQDHSATNLDMRNLFGFCEGSEWCGNIGMSTIIQVAPMTLQDFLSSSEDQLEVSREFVLEKVALVVVGYFCVSTEKRLAASGAESAECRKAEYWHGKAVELGYCFLPANCPLFAHIYTSYQKHYSVLHQPIVHSPLTSSLKTRRPRAM